MKKAVTSLLLAAMLLSLFIGCGATNEVSASTSVSPPEESVLASLSQEQITSSAEPPEETAASVVSEELGDAITEEPSYFPLSEKSELSIWYPFPSNISDYIQSYDEHPVFQAVEAATNVKIEFVSCSDYQTGEQFSLMCASGDYCDMITKVNQNYTNGLVGAMEDEVIIPLNAYMEYAPNYSAILQKYPDAEQAIKTDHGDIAMFAWIEGEQYVSSGPQIRQDWLNALNMDIPETYDQLETYLEAIQSVYGCSSPYLVNSSSFSEILADGYGVAGCQIGGPEASGSAFYQENGRVHCSYLEDGFRDYLTMMHNWFEKGLFSRDFLNISSNPMDSIVGELITTNQTGAWFDSVDSLSNYMVLTEGTGFAVSPMPAPGLTGYAVSHFGSEYNHVMGNTVSVSTQCRDIELAMRWLDFFYSDEGALLANFGVEGEAYDYDENGQLYVTDLILNNPNGLNYNQAAYLYTLGGNFITYTEESSSARTWTWQFDFANENAKNFDSACVLPGSLSLTMEESQSIATVLSDLETYANEMVTRFVVGESDIQQEWDTMVQYLNDNGMANCIDAYQAALDRYYNR